MTRDEFDTNGKSIYAIIIEVRRLEREVRAGNRHFRELFDHITKLAEFFPEAEEAAQAAKDTEGDLPRKTRKNTKESEDE